MKKIQEKENKIRNTYFFLKSRNNNKKLIKIAKKGCIYIGNVLELLACVLVHRYARLSIHQEELY